MSLLAAFDRTEKMATTKRQQEPLCLGLHIVSSRHGQVDSALFGARVELRDFTGLKGPVFTRKRLVSHQGCKA